MAQDHGSQPSQDPPAFLPPRKPSSTPSSREVTPKNSAQDLRIPASLPPRQPANRLSSVPSERRWSESSEQDDISVAQPSRSCSLRGSNRLRSSRQASSVFLAESGSPRDGTYEGTTHRSRASSVEQPGPSRNHPSRASEPNTPVLLRPATSRQSVLRQSSLRHENTFCSNDVDHGFNRSSYPAVLDSVHTRSRPGTALSTTYSESQPPLSRYSSMVFDKRRDSLKENDPGLSTPHSANGATTPVLTPKPRASFTRLSSLDNLMLYREEKAEWKRASYILHPTRSEPLKEGPCDSTVPDTPKDSPSLIAYTEKEGSTSDGTVTRMGFRHFIAEIGFCYTIAMTQFLAEYLISGFAVVLPKLVSNTTSTAPGGTGEFWPAALLSLILSATLLIFARISDIFGGYLPFMFGLIWLTIWTLVPGLSGSAVILDLSRAMQGLAIAAFMPSTFTMVGSIYPEGPRRNIVLGLYGACAPLGFYAGFLAGGALPLSESQWYFWIAAILAFTTAITAYLCVPADRTDRRRLGIKMDWLGAFLITGGLILLAYALTVEPYADEAANASSSGWRSPEVLGCFVSGVVCLAVAVWVEGWYAECPLLPFDFFKPRGVLTYSLACLFFYGSFGVWLYNSAEFFTYKAVTGHEDGVSGIVLALWYTPTAVGGILFCIVGGSLLHIIPTKLLIILSGLAWVGAPLIFAAGPLPLKYWAQTMPSMLCATLGIDLTFTISTIFLSSSQPLRYQGVAGAVSSILVNLGMSLSLPISEIVMKGAHKPDNKPLQCRAAFIYAAASAGVGLLICIFFVRISRSVMSNRTEPEDEETSRRTSSDARSLEGSGSLEARVLT